MADQPVKQTDSKSPCYAVNFSGEMQYITLGDAQGLGFTKSFTLECWTFIHSMTNGDNTILGSEEGNSHRCLHLLFRNGHPYLGFYNDDAASPLSIRNYQWSHLAFVFDEAPPKTQSIYVNGHCVVSSPNHQNLQGNQNINLNRYIGRGRALYGLVTDIHIWNRPLTEKEISRSMKTPRIGSESGLTACWDFKQKNMLELVSGEIRGVVNGNSLRGPGMLEFVEIPSLKERCFMAHPNRWAFLMGLHPRLGADTIMGSDAFAKNEIFEKNILSLVFSYFDSIE